MARTIKPMDNAPATLEIIRLYPLFLNSPALLFDTQGVIQDVSKQLCELINITPESLTGQMHPFWNVTGMLSDLGQGRVWTTERAMTGGNGSWHWLHCTVLPMFCKEGHISHFMELLVDRTEQKLKELQAEQLAREHTEELEIVTRMLEDDVEERRQVEQLMREQQDQLVNRNVELQLLNGKLEQMQGQLLQSEKLASIGQLAAGVAHEINNPIGYVNSNLSSLENYLADLFNVLGQYELVESHLPDAVRNGPLAAAKQQADMVFLKQDLTDLLAESKEGISRVKKIVQDLKDFSRVDSTEQWEMADLHRCLDSTLNIVHNEIKYKAEVKKEYGELPNIECLPSQLNQVFMNLLVNAGHAIKESGVVWIKTGIGKERIWVEIEDNGCGISSENLKKVFDPFFTTKPVGKGTGLGLSLSYGIIQKHGGEIEVHSQVGKGTTFRVWLPMVQKHLNLAGGDTLQPGNDQSNSLTESLSLQGIAS